MHQVLTKYGCLGENNSSNHLTFGEIFVSPTFWPNLLPPLKITSSPVQRKFGNPIQNHPTIYNN